MLLREPQRREREKPSATANHQVETAAKGKSDHVDLGTWREAFP